MVVLIGNFFKNYIFLLEILIIGIFCGCVAGFIDFTEQAIYVNAADPYNRQTFTIAHELGHYFLHKEYYKQHPEAYRVLLRRPVGRQNNPLEKEANAFAPHLEIQHWNRCCTCRRALPPAPPLMGRCTSPRPPGNMPTDNYSFTGWNAVPRGSWFVARGRSMLRPYRRDAIGSWFLVLPDP